MKFYNKKQIQKLYRKQIQEKKDQDYHFLETVIIILIVAVILSINAWQ